MKESILILLCFFSINALAQPSRCLPQEQSELSVAYEQFRSASRAGDLNQVKMFSSRSVLADISEFEKAAPSASDLARQMGFVMPLLSEAKEIRCEISGQRARFVLLTESTDRESKKTIPITTVVMFWRESGTKWLVGEKAMTNPFSPQSPDELLRHEMLRLP